MISRVNVCHLSTAHLADDTRIFYNECISLADNGYNVSLIAHGLEGNQSGVTFVPFPKMSRKERIVKGLKLMYSLAMQVDADLYHLHDPELLLLVPSLKKHNKIVVFDSHEDVPKQILYKEHIPKLFRKIISLVYKKFEERILRKVDGILVVTPSQLPRFSRFHNNVMMVTNYPRREESEGFRIKQPLSSVFQLCFAGGISAQWCHHNLVLGMKDIENVRYVIAGPYESTEYLNIVLENTEKVEYLGILKKEVVEELYHSSHCGIALLSYDTQMGREGTLGNTKLFEFMKYGLPIICSDLTIWKNIIDTYDCGITVNPNDVKQISEAIQFLLTNPKELDRMGMNGYSAYQRVFNWDTQVPHLLKLYSNCLDNQQHNDFLVV